MDKFQAIRYLVAVAEGGSFSAAARMLGITTSAVKKLINALERDLRCILLQPKSRGVALTADGIAYYHHCRRLLQDFATAEAEVAGSRQHPSGMLRVGMNPSVAAYCVMPELPRFHERYPEIQIDCSLSFAPTDLNQQLDVFVLMAWQSAPGFIMRRLAESRFLVCAAPSYWARAGTPEEPKDLAAHTGVNFRARVGTVLDRWIFERGGEVQTVDLHGYAVSNDRNALLQVALGGGGVMVVTDITTQRHLADGSLVPALLEWRIKHPPPIDILYRANQRDLPRVRVFVDFVIDVFRRLDAKRVPSGHVPMREPAPTWLRTGTGRTSATRERI